MIKTQNRYIRDFDFDTESYYAVKHKYEPSNICEMPVKWSMAKDFNVYDDKGNKWIDMTSGIFVTNAGHSNPNINLAIKNNNFPPNESFLCNWCYLWKNCKAKKVYNETNPSVNAS